MFVKTQQTEPFLAGFTICKTCFHYKEENGFPAGTHVIWHTPRKTSKRRQLPCSGVSRNADTAARQSTCSSHHPLAKCPVWVRGESQAAALCQAAEGNRARACQLPQVWRHDAHRGLPRGAAVTPGDTWASFNPRAGHSESQGEGQESSGASGQGRCPISHRVEKLREAWGTRRSSSAGGVKVSVATEREPKFKIKTGKA